MPKTDIIETNINGSKYSNEAGFREFDANIDTTQKRFRSNDRNLFL